MLADREAMYERVVIDARSSEERAERLSAQLSDAQLRLRETEEQLRGERETNAARAVELDRVRGDLDMARVQLSALHDELTQANATITAMRSQISDKDAGLRAGAERIAALETELAERARDRDAVATLEAELEERTRERDDLAGQTGDVPRTADLERSLYERNQELASARDEASKAQVWLRRALAESAEYKASLSAAEARVAELDELVTAYRAELEERAAAAAENAGTASDGPSSARELATVLQVTEEAVVRIMESTRARADQELRSIDDDRERIGREVEAMVAWRDRAAPMITSLEATMRDVTREVAEIGVRVDEVLRPFTGAVTRMSSQLASLDGLSRTLPPPPEDAPAPTEGARIIELRDDQSAARERWPDS